MINWQKVKCHIFAFWISLVVFTLGMLPWHFWFLEHWNRQKSLRNIWQRFSCLLDEWIANISKKIFFTVAFWDNPHYPFWDLRSRDLKNFLGYDINYLSIWPFIGHPWFPTRKASKLRFTCFQLAGWWPCDCFQIAGWCHSPASWKQVNLSFEAFLVGNQGWPINGQMLRFFSLFRGSIYQQCYVTPHQYTA